VTGALAPRKEDLVAGPAEETEPGFQRLDLQEKFAPAQRESCSVDETRAVRHLGATQRGPATVRVDIREAVLPLLTGERRTTVDDFSASAFFSRARRGAAVQVPPFMRIT
jgi:hypothetical protein